MKKFLLIILSFVFTLNVYSQSGNFCDDFETYSSGDPICQTSPSWNSWGELMSGLTAPFTDDANVTDLYANSGSFSLGFNANPRTSFYVNLLKRITRFHCGDLDMFKWLKKC